jgi:hypothetical protein
MPESTLLYLYCTVDLTLGKPRAPFRYYPIGGHARSLKRLVTKGRGLGSPSVSGDISLSNSSDSTCKL